MYNLTKKFKTLRWLALAFQNTILYLLEKNSTTNVMEVFNFFLIGFKD